ncbi:MucB/RseB C-terminal domain-containing protein [Methylomonas sp. MgM2]
MRAQNYHGTVVFMKNGQIDTMKYRHAVDGGVETERLTSLNSPLRELVRKSNEVKCLYKETQKKVESRHPIDRSFILNLPKAPERVDDQYLLVVAGQEMVAMRPTQIIAVLPKDDLRYARKIWVDVESLLPLKVEVYGAEGNVLEQVLFTEFDIDSIDSNPQVKTSSAQTDQASQQYFSRVDAFDDTPFLLHQMPAGFEKVFFIRNTMQQSKRSVDHLLISDGFSNISIYFEEKAEQDVEGIRTLGPVNSFSRVIGDWQVTVLGEVPLQTVELVANGVSLRSN